MADTILKQLQSENDSQKVDEGLKYPNFRIPIDSTIKQLQSEVLTEVPQGFTVYPNFRYSFDTIIKQIQCEMELVPFIATRNIQYQ
jgi:hypothetical protein